MAEVAEQYAALGVSDHEIWSDCSKHAQESVRVLALLGNQQVRPVLLAALHGNYNAFLERLLQMLVILTVRYQVIGRGRTGALEIACARVAPLIFKGELRSVSKMWKEFSTLVPDDKVFRQDFAQHSESKAPRARYLLRQLELVSAGGDSELRPAEDLSLEHICPRNPSGDWQEELRADRELVSHVDRLGNLCLLTEKQNRKIGNRGFSEKARELYGRSELHLTKAVAERWKGWSRKAIEERQELLAGLATRAWPLPHQVK